MCLSTKPTKTAITNPHSMVAFSRNPTSAPTLRTKRSSTHRYLGPTFLLAFGVVLAIAYMIQSLAELGVRPICTTTIVAGGTKTDRTTANGEGGSVATSTARGRCSRYKNVPHTIMMAFILSRLDAHMQRRIIELQEAFGRNLVLVWDDGDTLCPVTLARIANCLDLSHQSVSERQQFSHIGRGMERAVMWAISHASTTTSTGPEDEDDKDEEDNRRRMLFQYVWFMEDDVSYTDITQLIELVDRTGEESTAGLLHQEQFFDSDEIDWYWRDSVMNETAQYDPFGTTPMHNTLFNLFRASTTLLNQMGDFYQQNHHQWVFFEALIPTLVLRHNLRQVVWSDYMNQTYNRPSFMRFRPCHTSMDQPGIYHPVKYRNGTYVEC